MSLLDDEGKWSWSDLSPLEVEGTGSAGILASVSAKGTSILYIGRNKFTAKNVLADQG